MSARQRRSLNWIQAYTQSRQIYRAPRERTLAGYCQAYPASKLHSSSTYGKPPAPPPNCPPHSTHGQKTVDFLIIIIIVCVIIVLVGTQAIPEVPKTVCIKYLESEYSIPIKSTLTNRSGKH